MTRLARPYIVILGITIIGVDYCFAPILFQIFGRTFVPVTVPPEFFWGFWATVGLYVGGRSLEKLKGVAGEIESIPDKLGDK
jgi:hypothetical protein